MKDFGILVFSHTRALLLSDLLESLDRQDAIGLVDLWVDGYQGKSDLKDKVQITRKIGDGYKVGVRRYHQGGLGFRKMMLQAMQSATTNYKHILFLEDDCFPTRKAVSVFREELEEIESNDEVFSVYGHPFSMAEESGFCTRFQGWGWGTTAEKLATYVEKLIQCYSMPEQDYLDFTNKAMTKKVLERLDATPGRQPSDTLRQFFAWDETLALLTAMDNKLHKLTAERVIYNCGMGEGSAHFVENKKFREPPFNMIAGNEVWDHFE